MLPPDLSTAVWLFQYFLVVFLLILAWYCWKTARYCREAVDWVQYSNKRSVSLRRIAEVESTLTELLDSYEALLTSHKKLRSRIGMRENRSPGKKPDAPDSEQGRLAEKERLRDEARAKGLLR